MITKYFQVPSFLLIFYILMALTKHFSFSLFKFRLLIAKLLHFNQFFLFGFIEGLLLFLMIIKKFILLNH